MHPFVCFSKLRFAFLDRDLLVKTPLEGMNRKTSDAVNPGFVASSIRNKYVYHFGGGGKFDIQTSGDDATFEMQKTF